MSKFIHFKYNDIVNESLYNNILMTVPQVHSGPVGWSGVFISHVLEEFRAQLQREIEIIMSNGDNGRIVSIDSLSGQNELFRTAKINMGGNDGDDIIIKDGGEQEHHKIMDMPPSICLLMDITSEVTKIATTEHCLGFIKKIYSKDKHSNKFRIVFPQCFENDVKNLKMWVLCGTTSSSRIYEALESFFYSLPKFVEDIIQGDHIYSPVLGGQLVPKIDQYSSLLLSLNPSQRTSIERIFTVGGAGVPSIQLILGPPGKSHLYFVFVYHVNMNPCL